MPQSTCAISQFIYIYIFWWSVSVMNQLAVASIWLKRIASSKSACSCCLACSSACASRRLSNVAKDNCSSSDIPTGATQSDAFVDFSPTDVKLFERFWWVDEPAESFRDLPPVDMEPARARLEKEPTVDLCFDWPPIELDPPDLRMEKLEKFPMELGDFNPLVTSSGEPPNDWMCASHVQWQKR